MESEGGSAFRVEKKLIFKNKQKTMQIQGHLAWPASMVRLQRGGKKGGAPGPWVPPPRNTGK